MFTGSHFKTLLFAVLVTGLFVSCTDENGRKGRPLIKDFSIVDESKGCGADQYYILEENSCVSVCEEGTKVATQDEIDEILNDDEIDDSVAEQIREILAGSKGGCIPDIVPVVRPDKQVYVKRDFCSCLSGKSDILNNCDAFCASNVTTQPTLFGKVTVGPDIELNEGLKTLHGWCTREIDDGGTAPTCSLNLYNDRGSENIAINIPSGSNTFTANLSTLPFDTTYVAKIIVSYGSDSGIAAESDTFQIRRIQQRDEDTTPVGLLALSDVTQYTCVTRSGRTSGSDNIFDGAARLHFYFPSDNSPVPQPPGPQFLICHDVQAHGNDDSALHDRLEAIQPWFKVWNQNDIRFADANANSRPDINEILERRLSTEFGVTRTVNIFGLFSWPNRPNSGTTPPNVGFYMQPWINSTTGRAFCPKQEQYNSSDPLFKLLREYIGVDTEGIYLGEKEQEVIGTNSDGTPQLAPQDVLIIRENVLKQVWFYYENGRHYTPTEVTAGQKTIHFYYPIKEGGDPHVKQSDQRLYTVRAPSAIGAGGTSTGLTTVVNPPDKRFGCVPALD